MKQKNRQLINGLPRRILLMLLDCGLIVFCYYLAILLRFDGEDSIVPAAVLRAEVIRAMARITSARSTAAGTMESSPSNRSRIAR